nr:TIGR00282 family metallophosphoesterase [uncultured Ruminococcus sp.]
MLDENPFIVRPANFPDRVPGKGIINLDMGRRIVTIINLMGNMGMDDGLENAFDCADRLLEQAESKIILLDFHAETTSEKRALGYYLDGRVSAVFGTHTHVQTSDAQVLPNGTGYITDLGMTGTIHSVLGVKTDIIINRFRTKLPARFELADGACRLEAALFEIDDKNGKCLNAESLRIE